MNSAVAEEMQLIHRYEMICYLGIKKSALDHLDFIVIFLIMYFLHVLQISGDGNSLCLMYNIIKQIIKIKTFCIYSWSGLSQCLRNL